MEQQSSDRGAFIIKKHKLMAAASRCAVLQSHCEDLISEGYTKLQGAADLLKETGEEIMAAYEEHLASDPRKMQLVKEEEAT